MTARPVAPRATDQQECTVVGRPPTPDERPGDGALRRARAVASPTRAAMLELLRAAPGPLTAQQMAAELGVHHTAVRQHCEVLAEAGLVVGETFPPQGRGRPRMGYRLVETPDPYKWLATLLAESVREGRSPIETGRLHGERATPSPEGPAETIRAEAERLGFRPDVRRGRGGRVELVLQECPFADVADADPATVCALHRGLAEGVASVCGGIEVESLKIADPHAGGCRLVLRAT